MTIPPAGFSPVVESPLAFVSDAADSLLFDLVTRTFPTLPDGSLQTVHWVDEMFALALGFELGSIRSAPDVGFNVQRLRRAPANAIEMVMKDEVRVATSRITTPGHATILAVAVDARFKGRIVGDVTYVNNRKNSTTARPTTLRLTSNG